LKNYPEKERQLWRIFDKTPFESIIAMAEIEGNDIIKSLDSPAYFALLGIPLPESDEGILKAIPSFFILFPYSIYLLRLF